MRRRETNPSLRRTRSRCEIVDRSSPSAVAISVTHASPWPNSVKRRSRGPSPMARKMPAARSIAPGCTSAVCWRERWSCGAQDGSIAFGIEHLHNCSIVIVHPLPSTCQALRGKCYDVYDAMLMKRALITGVSGQDGSYLAEFLLRKGYEVHGIKRRSRASTRAA